MLTVLGLLFLASPCFGQAVPDKLPEPIELARLNVLNVGGGTPPPAASNPVIEEGDRFSDYQTSTITGTVTALTQGHLVVVYVLSDVDISTVTGTGITFSSVYAYAHSSRVEIFSGTVATGGATSIALNYTGTGYALVWVLHISGADSVDDVGSLENGYGVTDCGTGTIDATQNGLAIAAFHDVYGNATGFSNGTGWTAGEFSAGSYYQYRAATASTSYGGANGQATVTGGGGDANVFGTVFNVY